MPNFEEMEKAVLSRPAKFGGWCKTCGSTRNATEIGDDCWGCWTRDAFVDDSGVSDGAA